MEMAEIKVRLAERITLDSVDEARKITGAKVKEAASLMKAAKSDITGGLTSDAILNAPKQLFDQLADLYGRSCGN